MSGEGTNFLIDNAPDNGVTIDGVRQLSEISMPSDVSLIATPTHSTVTNINSNNSGSNAYACYISQLEISSHNNHNRNTTTSTTRIVSSSSSIVNEPSTSIILTALEPPNIIDDDESVSAMPPMTSLMMQQQQQQQQHSCHNGFAQNISAHSNHHQLNVDHIRQNFTNYAKEKSYMRIIEEPTNRIRYRYRSEKGSHGGLTGENSTQSKKTYPTVKLENYRPRSQVYIRASLFTNEERPKNHVHKLMGRHCNEEGLCTIPLSENMTASFLNLGILFIGKKEVPDILYRRKLEETRILNSMVNNNASSLLTDIDKQRLREESEREAKDMNLNSVKICFEAFVQENEISYQICCPIFSRPVANQKSPDSGELKIVRMDRYSGVASGDDEVFLLCEKVNKKEIKIRFFETDAEGNQVWEAFGNFTEADVHHQVAIVFRTPPYCDPNISSSVQVYLQLYRPRDGEYSEPRPFTYRPQAHDLEAVERKRKKFNHYSTSIGDLDANNNNSSSNRSDHDFSGSNYIDISESTVNRAIRHQQHQQQQQQNDSVFYDSKK